MDSSDNVHFKQELEKFIDTDAAKLVSFFATPIRSRSAAYYNYWLREDKKYTRLQLLASIRFYYSVLRWNQWNSFKIKISALKKLKPIRVFEYYAVFSVDDKLLSVYNDANFHSPCFWDYTVSLSFNYAADLPYRHQRRNRRRKRRKRFV